MNLFLKSFALFFTMSFAHNLVAQSCMQLIWSDEFNGSTLDTTKWSYDIGNGCPALCGWGNNEQQYYSSASKNIRVQNGLLIITGMEDTLGGEEYSSAKIKSKGKGDFRYGKFEARMKFPSTQGVWPAFWMLPSEEVYGGWPNSGEMDIVEMVGKEPGQAVGTIHTGEPYNFRSGYYNLPTGQIFADNFHVFTMEWEPDSITWYVDGIRYHKLTPDLIGPWEPFQEDFYLILNLALGGNWPGNVDQTTVLPQTLEVDYVRVYSKPERLVIKGTQPRIDEVGTTYETFSVPSAKYIWSVPSDATIVAGQGTNKITVDWACTAGDVELELQTNCDTANLVYEVPRFAQTALSGPSTVSENQAGLTYAFSQTIEGTYSWQVPAGASIVSGQDSNKAVVNWGCNPGEVIVSFNSVCGITFKDTLAVTLKEHAIVGHSYVLPNATNQPYFIDKNAGDTFTWTVPTDVSIVSGLDTPAIEVNFGSTSGVISLEVKNSCGTKNYDFPVVVQNSFLFADFETKDLEFVPILNAVFKKVANPSLAGINTSDSVGLVYKTSASPRWAGIEADVPELPLDDWPVLTRKVFSSSTGEVSFQLYDQTSGVDRERIFVSYDEEDVNTWVQLVYDFSGMPADVFDRIRLTHNHYGESYSQNIENWYVDDVRIWSNEALTSSPKMEITKTITVYPNPSSGVFHLDTKDIFPVGSSYELEVVNSQGQSVCIQQIIHTKERATINLSNEAPGMYFIKLKGESIRYVKAIIKN
jgi:beta-glucanase (GH16 family)